MDQRESPRRTTCTGPGGLDAIGPRVMAAATVPGSRGLSAIGDGNGLTPLAGVPDTSGDAGNGDATGWMSDWGTGSYAGTGRARDGESREIRMRVAARTAMEPDATTCRVRGLMNAPNSGVSHVGMRGAAAAQPLVGAGCGPTRTPAAWATSLRFRRGPDKRNLRGRDRARGRRCGSSPALRIASSDPHRQTR